jgi:DUF1707 SHOCT-like domain
MAEDVPRYPRHHPPDRNLRAANADRDAIGEILRRQHVAGRLDTDEFAERYGRSLQAKTYSELDELIADLPADPEPAFSAGNRTAISPGGYPRAGRPSWMVPAFILLAVVAVLALASGGHVFWVAFPLFFFVVRPLMWRSGIGGRSGRWGPWGCHASGTRRGPTVL